MSNQNLSNLSPAMRQLYDQLAPQDIEQFYVGYQFLEAEQLALDLQDQISTLQQQIIENIGNIQATQPSALAMAALARLQSEGVRDVDLLDYLLLRGEEWLDQTMQRLDYCEQMGFIVDNDYTKWCEHALEGAYDWIDSVRESDESTSTDEQDSSSESDEASEDATSEGALEALPLDSSSTQLDPVNSDLSEQPVSEESLLKLLASDGDAEETDLPLPVGISASPAPEPEFAPVPQTQSADEEVTIPGAETGTEPITEVALAVPTEEVASSPAVETEVPTEVATLSPDTEEDVPTIEIASPFAAKEASPAEEPLLEPITTAQPVELASTSASALPPEDDEATVKMPQISLKRPRNPQKKDRSPNGIMATLIALKNKHLGHSEPPPPKPVSEFEVEETTAEIGMMEAVGGPQTPSPVTSESSGDLAAQDVPAPIASEEILTREATSPAEEEVLVEEATNPLEEVLTEEANTSDKEVLAEETNIPREEVLAEEANTQIESAPSASKAQTTEQGAQPAIENQLYAAIARSARPTRHRSTISRRNSPFLMKRTLKKIKKRKNVKTHRLSQGR